jgi:hypothetical protein
VSIEEAPSLTLPHGAGEGTREKDLARAAKDPPRVVAEDVIGDKGLLRGAGEGTGQKDLARAAGERIGEKGLARIVRTRVEEKNSWLVVTEAIEEKRLPRGVPTGSHSALAS